DHGNLQDGAGDSPVMLCVVRLPNHPKEVLVKAWIPRYLRMERGAKQVSLTDRHNGLIIQSRKHLNAVANRRDGRPADKYRMERRFPQRWHGQVSLEARALRAKRVASGVDIQRRQEWLTGECVVGLTREQD